MPDINVGAFISQYGYPAIFAGTFFGGTLVVVAGFPARQDYLQAPLAALAACGGDQLLFFLPGPRERACCGIFPGWPPGRALWGKRRAGMKPR